MSKSIKEVLISTMQNGPEVLNELAMARIVGSDIENQRSKTGAKINQYHPKTLNLRVIEKEQLDPLATRIRLSSRDGQLPVFEAGQYINLFVEIDGVRTSRPYSIATSPLERGYYDIIVARTANGFVSNYLIERLQPGDELSSTGPMGTFRYQAVHHKSHQVMLAGGSGITPMQSMILDSLGRGLDRRLTLIYGVRRLEYATNHELFTRLAHNHPNFRYIPVLSDESSDIHECGFVTKELIERHVPDVHDATFFLCGPQIMNTYCQGQLEEMGIRRGMIRRELFQSRKDIENEPGWPAEISPEAEFEISCAGHRFKAKAGENLLVALERQNITVNVGCRSGECSYCRMKLVRGNVFTAQGSLMRHADEIFGYIHSCKTYPISDIELAF